MDTKKIFLWARGLLGVLLIIVGFLHTLSEIVIQGYTSPFQVIFGLVVLGLGTFLAKPFVEQQGWLKTGAVLGGLVLAIPLVGYVLNAETRKQEDLKDLLERKISQRLDPDASITDISVVQEEGNNYQALIRAEDQDGTINISMDVVYDGDRFIFNARNWGREQ